MLFINRRGVCCLALLSALLMIQVPHGAAAADAAARIKNFSDTLLNTTRSGASTQERFRRLLPSVEATFDIGSMARIAVGPTWNSIPGNQQSQIRESFGRLIAASYANKFNRFEGERIEVDPNAVDVKGAKLVKTKIIEAKGDVTPINYLTRGGRVIDVYLNGSISELASRRSEFSGIIASSGAAGLIASLRNSVARLLGS